VAARLIGSGEAARALGINTRTLARWVQEGRVTPALVTAGGHYRFELEDLKAQLAELARKKREERE
jgi:excisionase family DNA binding protein